jgi:hypothetical protein
MHVHEGFPPVGNEGNSGRYPMASVARLQRERSAATARE